MADQLLDTIERPSASSPSSLLDRSFLDSYQSQPSLEPVKPCPLLVSGCNCVALGAHDYCLGFGWPTQVDDTHQITSDGPRLPVTGPRRQPLNSEWFSLLPPSEPERPEKSQRNDSQREIGNGKVDRVSGINPSLELARLSDIRQGEPASQLPSPTVVDNRVSNQGQKRSRSLDAQESEPKKPKLSQSNYKEEEKKWVEHYLRKEVASRNWTESKWENISRELAKHGIERSKSSIKAWWSRHGREETGFEERQKPQGRKLVTSKQKPEDRRKARQSKKQLKEEEGEGQQGSKRQRREL
ncbi:MAG: hypothetical protein L6R40_001264 [Gallowayella cf. fulva]|nr:MAG: hypothetical protein L6R40_001264 [Xanthomendoza cf. fulva]